MDRWIRLLWAVLAAGILVCGTTAVLCMAAAEGPSSAATSWLLSGTIASIDPRRQRLTVGALDAIDSLRGTTFRVGPATAITDGRQPVAFDQLRPGHHIAVEYTQSDDGALLAQMITLIPPVPAASKVVPPTSPAVPAEQ